LSNALGVADSTVLQQHAGQEVIKPPGQSLANRGCAAQPGQVQSIGGMQGRAAAATAGKLYCVSCVLFFASKKQMQLH
jgi:hypothetical protein